MSPARVVASSPWRTLENGKKKKKERKKKRGAHRERDRFLSDAGQRMIRSLDGRRGDQRFRAASLQTRKGAKARGRGCAFTLSFPLPARRTDNDERIGRASERRREERRSRSSRRVRRQPVTNLTLNQLTCARLHGRTNARRCIRARGARPRCGLPACNMCNIMYAMLPSRILSRRRRPAK